MKTFKYIFLLGALLLASCTDFLDKSPDDMETLDMVFGNKVNTEEWLAGCYSPETISNVSISSGDLSRKSVQEANSKAPSKKIYLNVFISLSFYIYCFLERDI